MLKVYQSNTQALIVDEESMIYYPMTKVEGQAVARSIESNVFWTEAMHKEIEFLQSKGYRRLHYVESKR